MDINQKFIDGLDNENIDPELRVKAINDLKQNLFLRVGARITEDLEDDDLEVANGLLASDPEQAFAYIDTKVANFEAIVDEEIELLIEEYNFLNS